MSEQLESADGDGQRCAARGGQSHENPFLGGGDDPRYLAWNRGFRAARIPDSACPNCKGTGRLVFRSTSGEEPLYDGASIEDLCNDPVPPTAG
jgi:hypothetical protein